MRSPKPISPPHTTFSKPSLLAPPPASTTATSKFLSCFPSTVTILFPSPSTPLLPQLSPFTLTPTATSFGFLVLCLNAFSVNQKHHHSRLLLTFPPPPLLSRANPPPAPPLTPPSLPPTSALCHVVPVRHRDL
ncbi:hypothetical protein V6N13_048069 [Hibiscus sabdariffa]